jgi:DNA-binding SARP family transcriptional activator
VTARIQLAGPLEVAVGDARLAPSDFPGRQGRLVFAALTLAHGPVDRNELADILWPNRLPASWTRDLSAVISKLRALLAGTAELVTGGGRWYALELPGATIDVERAALAIDRAERDRADGALDAALREAATAAAILAEPFLAGDECPWVDDRRTELREQLRRAYELRADVLAEQQSPAALAAAQALLDLEPQREHAHVLLMRAQLALGDRVEALRTYERLRAMLADDFGLLPSLAADELMRVALGPDDAAADAPPTAPLPAAIVDARRTPIIGRAVELRALAPLFDEDTGARLAALLGPAGIGKSRVAAESASHASERGQVVLHGACSDGPTAPYSVIVDAFTSFRLAGADDRTNGLADDVIGHLVAQDEGVAAEARPRTDLFAEVANAVRAFAEHRTLLLVLDDVHWADHASMRLVEQLLRAVANVRVLVTARLGEVDETPAGRMLARLRTTDGALIVPVDGLGLSEVGVALHEHGAGALEPALISAVHRATAGNPLYVREIGRHLAVTGPPSGAVADAALLDAIGLPQGLAELIDANLARLGAPTRHLLEVGAVIGGSIELGVLLRACRLPDRELLAAVDVARRAGVLVDAATSGSTLRFEHPLVREVLVRGLGGAHRAHLHQLVAEAIEALHHDEVDHFSAELAHHLAAAANVSSARDAIEFAVRAGERANAVCAYDEAVQWYSHALRLSHAREDGPPRTVRLLLALGDAKNHAGDAHGAHTTLLEAVDRARGAGDAELWAGAVLSLSRVLVDAGFEGGMVDTELVTLLQEAIAALDDASTVRAQLQVRLAQELHFAGDRDRCLALCDDAEAAARDAGDTDALAVVLGARHYALYGTPDVQPRLALLTELQTLQTRVRPDARWPRDYLELGDLQAVEASAAHLERQLATSAIASDRYYPAVLRSALAALRGDLEAAEAAADEAVEVGRAGARGPAAVAGVWAAQIFAVRLFDGRLGELSEIVDATADATPGRPIWRAAAAFMHLELDERARAEVHFRCLRRAGFSTLPDTLDRPLTLAMLAWVGAEIGSLADARELRRLLRPYQHLLIVQGAAAPAVCAGPFTYPLGMLEARLGRDEAACALLERAELVTTEIGAWRWRDRIRDARARLAQSPRAALT